MTDLMEDGKGAEARMVMAAFVGDGADETTRQDASPLDQVHAAAPPMLIITGDSDTLTPVGMLRRFHAALDEAGVPNRLDVFPGRGHAFDFNTDDWKTAFELMHGFLDRHLSGTVTARP